MTVRLAMEHSAGNEGIFSETRIVKICISDILYTDDSMLSNATQCGNE